MGVTSREPLNLKDAKRRTDTGIGSVQDWEMVVNHFRRQTSRLVTNHLRKVSMPEASSRIDLSEPKTEIECYDPRARPSRQRDSTQP